MKSIVDWTNQNSGFLTLILFLVTLLFGWMSGIFKNLMRKPKLKIQLLSIPTFLCVFPTKDENRQEDTHRVAAVIYLSITNIGTSPTQIVSVRLGYHNYTFKYTFLWFWLNTTSSLGDFGHTIGEKLKVFPFLFQKNALYHQNVDTYLNIGQNTKGVMYFEQPESWGGFKPRVKNGWAKVKVQVIDGYGKRYSKLFKLEIVDITYAKKFNANFGQTLAKIEENPIEEWNQ